MASLFLLQQEGVAASHVQDALDGHNAHVAAHPPREQLTHAVVALLDVTTCMDDKSASQQLLHWLTAMKLHKKSTSILLVRLNQAHIVPDAMAEGAHGYVVLEGDVEHNKQAITLAMQAAQARAGFEEQLLHAAHYDPLTGLPNRHMFEQYLEYALERAVRWQRHQTIIMLDMDRFACVSEHYGVNASNAVLKEVAHRIKSALRTTDIAARYAGDMFAVLLDDHNQDQRLSGGKIVVKLLESFHKPFYYQTHIIDLSASIGVAIYPESGEDFGTLVHAAQQAVHQAKEAGGYQFRFAKFAKL